jgi:hypothetical protein
MNKVPLFCSLAFLIIITSCSKDDDLTQNELFFDGALASATSEQLEGKWSIFQVEYENERVDLPASYVECGRDFFEYQSNGSYREYLFNDNFECTPDVQMLTWTLSNGIIRVNNSSEMDQLVITELSSDLLVFKFRLDINSNGTKETFKAICRRYEPPTEMDIYSQTFVWDNSDPHNEEIYLKWDGYRGYNNFEKYEIYRLDEDCDVSNAQLISTITNVEKTFFIDESPDPYEQICYVLKIYTSTGILGESRPLTVSTYLIDVGAVNLAVPVLNGTDVQLNWEPFEGYYFSHYQIVARNHSSGTGANYVEEEIAIIDDINVTDEIISLPYFENPIFVVYVHNIFGFKTRFLVEGQNQRSSNFNREEILSVGNMKFVTVSPNEPVIYHSDFTNLYKYNYKTNIEEASIVLNSSSINFIEFIQSTFGDEIVVSIGSTIKVYDTNLNFKFELESPDRSFYPENVILSKNGYWLFTDRTKLDSYSRTGTSLSLISSNSLYDKRFSGSEINLIDIGQNRILIGNVTQSQGLIVGINDNGELSNVATAVAINLYPRNIFKSLFSKDEQYVLNPSNNTIYSADTYNLITTLNSKFFTSGISNNGKLILGTNNNPETSSTSFHEKNVKILNYPDLSEQVYESKGYPQFLFQNYRGQIISISKGTVGTLSRNSPEKDLFLEIIE